MNRFWCVFDFFSFPAVASGKDLLRYHKEEDQYGSKG